MNEEAAAKFVGALTHYYTCSMCSNVKSFKKDPVVPVFIDAHIYGLCPACKGELDTGQSKGVGFAMEVPCDEGADGQLQHGIVNAYSEMMIPEDDYLGDDNGDAKYTKSRSTRPHR